MTTTDWPFDADRDDPLTKLRIPVTSYSPEWRYTACFDRESETRPTSTEALMIASFIEQYQDHWFGNGSWRKKQQAKAFDMDCYTTTVFHKWGAGDWSYRCITWQYGPFWVPVHPRLRGGEYDDSKVGPLTLVQVMDRVHNMHTKYPSTDWASWKAARPGIFGKAASHQ